MIKGILTSHQQQCQHWGRIAAARLHRLTLTEKNRPTQLLVRMWYTTYALVAQEKLDSATYGDTKLGAIPNTTGAVNFISESGFQAKFARCTLHILICPDKDGCTKLKVL